MISDLEELKQYITEYDMKLFGKEEVADIHLSEELWSTVQKVSAQENEKLTQPSLVEKRVLVLIPLVPVVFKPGLRDEFSPGS